MPFHRKDAPSILSVHRIWDLAPHCSMTDLIYFKERWFCAFRESDKHVYGQNGMIRIIASEDGLYWSSAAVFEAPGIDLRDPKLSVMPDGRLLLLVGGTEYKRKKYISRQPRVAFSENGYEWEPFQLILEPHEWLWRLTWYQGKGYGVSYSFVDPSQPRGEWRLKLYKTEDALHYVLVQDLLEVTGNPNEVTLGFLQGGEIVGIFRRDKKGDSKAWIGRSFPPYQTWRWQVASQYVGGPNLIITSQDEIWIAGRLIARTPYGLMEKMALLKPEEDRLKPVLILPSGGDSGYPGLVLQDGILWISYYSSHEGKTSIYLARILLPLD